MPTGGNHQTGSACRQNSGLPRCSSSSPAAASCQGRRATDGGGWGACGSEFGPWFCHAAYTGSGCRRIEGGVPMPARRGSSSAAMVADMRLV